MSIAISPPKAWTLEEFERQADLGLFDGQRVELIEGEVISMGQQGSRHYVALTLTSRILEKVFGSGYWVRSQGPLRFPHLASSPSPDVGVVIGGILDYTDHPQTAVLVVEVSDSTLGYDRNRVARLYARAGIGDYWIVDIVHRQLEVHRDPQGEDGYRSRTVLGEEETVEPLACPGHPIRVSDLFPSVA